MKTVELNREINPDSVVVNAFRPYSGTELRKICIEKGLIPKEDRAEDNRAYGALEEIGVQPNIYYQTIVRNTEA